MKIKIHPNSGITDQEITQIINECSYIDSGFEKLSPDLFLKADIDGLGQFVLEDTLSGRYAYQISYDIFEIIGILDQ